jgi:hypothetical protein
MVASNQSSWMQEMGKGGCKNESFCPSGDEMNFLAPKARAKAALLLSLNARLKPCSFSGMRLTGVAKLSMELSNAYLKMHFSSSQGQQERAPGMFARAKALSFLTPDARLKPCSFAEMQLTGVTRLSMEFWNVFLKRGRQACSVTTGLTSQVSIAWTTVTHGLERRTTVIPKQLALDSLTCKGQRVNIIFSWL